MGRRVIVRCCLIAAVLLGSGLRFGFPQTQQPGALVIINRPFEPAEELFYDAEFSRAILRKLDVAEFKFRASRVPFISPTDGQNDPPGDPPDKQLYSLSLNADITSKGFFTRLFNLNFREKVESTVEPISFTVQRTIIHDEQGKRVRLTESTFDREKGKLSWTLRDPNNPSSEPRKAIADFSGQLQDVLSAIYFVRTQHLEVGKPFDIFVGDGGRVYKVLVNVVEIKRMKTILGKVNVIRVDPKLFGPGGLIEKEKGEFSIWLTGDSRHIPVASRIKTDYGTFEIKLKRAVYDPPK